MRMMYFAMPAALVTTLFAGCVADVDGDLGDEANADPSSLSDSAAPTGPDAAASVIAPLDGRAAADAEGKFRSLLGILPLGLTSQWYSGTVAPGVTQHWYWNNSSLTAAYQVGLSPIGASTTSACQFEVTRTWDVQRYGGEREFHFDIKNTGAIACGANVLLGSKTRVATWGTLGIAPGASKNMVWNNANPLTAAYFVGISPDGATSGNPCELEVTRTWYLQQPSGEREFRFTVKNVGAIACQGDVQLALTNAASSSWSTSAIAAGATKSWVWNNANPLDRIYVPGLSPGGASGLSTCQLEVTQSYYRQVINSTGAAEREFRLSVKNVGSLGCFGTVLLNHVD
jgi:hypothetical protein